METHLMEYGRAGPTAKRAKGQNISKEGVEFLWKDMMLNGCRPSAQRKSELAFALGITKQRIDHWFANSRLRYYDANGTLNGNFPKTIKGSPVLNIAPSLNIPDCNQKLAPKKRTRFSVESLSDYSAPQSPSDPSFDMLPPPLPPPPTTQLQQFVNDTLYVHSYESGENAAEQIISQNCETVHVEDLFMNQVDLSSSLHQFASSTQPMADLPCYSSSASYSVALSPLRDCCYETSYCPFEMTTQMFYADANEFNCELESFEQMF